MNTSLKDGSNIHRAVVVSAGLALVLGLAACGGGGGGGAGGGNGPGSRPLNLVIGNSLPLSGISRQLGESGQKASDLAVTRIKQAISEAGSHHTINTVNEDQGDTTDSAVQSAKTLVDDDSASCLTGPWSAEAVAKTAENVAIPAKVLQISPVPTGNDVAELSDHDLVNSTALPQSVEGSAISNAIDSDLGATQGHTVNLATNHGSYGDTVGQDLVESWQGNDGTVGEQVVLSSPPLSTTSTSGYSTTTPGYGSGGYSGTSGYPSSSSSSAYSGQAYQLLSGNPDGVVIIDDLNGFTALAPALAAQSSWDPAKAWGGDQLVSPALPNQVGADTIDEFRALAPGAPRDSDASAAFLQAFKQAHPHDVTLAPYAAQEFDATILCYLAAVAAGSTDGQAMADELIDITAPGGDKFTWEQLPDAIKALEDGKDIDYTGASGPIDMDVHGDPTTGVFDVYRYTSSGLKVADEVSVSKPNPATP
jgi:ABC-type branched-subunit amino acid transport system substrate-binding protein